MAITYIAPIDWTQWMQTSSLSTYNLYRKRQMKGINEATRRAFQIESATDTCTYARPCKAAALGAIPSAKWTLSTALHWKRSKYSTSNNAIYVARQGELIESLARFDLHRHAHLSTGVAMWLMTHSELSTGPLVGTAAWHSLNTGLFRLEKLDSLQQQDPLAAKSIALYSRT